MFVPSNCHGRQRHRWRFAFTTMLMFSIGTLSSSGQAAEFDEELKAPMMKSQAALHSQMQGYAAKFAAMRAASPERLIRDSALAREKFDLVWQVQRAIDDRQPLGELADSGIILQADGRYLIDTKTHPEWNDLHPTIAALLSGKNLDRWVPLLLARGFRSEDVEILRAYVGRNDPEAASAAATFPLALAFSRTVRKLDTHKQPIPAALVQSFWYQRARAASESNRLWVDGLMKALDAQRGRVLLSSFLELDVTTYWSPEDVSAGIAALLAEVRRPDFEAIVTAEAKGVAR